ncbi:xanthine dehydrogenase family protein molybdopterin-binding subunit [Alicyclobacillus dauci]|uniref:Xanthine dehydrogenase family protein molybdopterin-binding subunit n=1 Tax=Alicyclobacillus dauci TaxID=1475485 RepID=A0ABY6YXE6_9BACL|nr:xanthine dehydrogenase family protein molybdopterin-binding subunit [Alicyclobacillus dauci]WAH35207.1 xanthine dehydrogenase family protein molybdopterin-binding subunit [Alicyclobacillus dauci]
MKYLGQPLKRRIDPGLLTGRGQYIADLDLPGTLSAAFLRSPHAHARIRDIDLDPARNLPGVVAVFGPKEGEEFPPLPLIFPHPNLTPKTQRPLQSVVHHVGEPVAMVVAENRYIAEDAIDLIKVDYEPFPAVSLLEDVRKPNAPLAHLDLKTNLAAHFSQSIGDASVAMKEAPVVITQKFEIGRVSCLPIETRGLLANWKQGGLEPSLEVYAATQGQHEMRGIYASLFGLSEQQVHVIAPNVGGAFGAKAPFYTEDYLVAFASREVGAPVRWIEDRIEHMQSCIHEREQFHEATLGVDLDGKIMAVTDSLYANTGAYVPWGIIVPLMTSTLIPGPYKVPNYRCDVEVYYTNTVPHAPFRGAGRPQAALIMNRLLDLAADRLNLDPVEIRKKNLIHADEFPYKTGLTARDGSPQIYDSGDYNKLVNELVDLGHYQEWREKQDESRKRKFDRQIGIGVAVAIENTGYGSFEGATVRVETNGEVSVFTGAASQGQSHETTLAQVAAEVLDLPLDRISVREGDTRLFPYGTGTFASRIATIAGTAVYKAASGIKDKAIQIAAHVLEVPKERLEYHEGIVRVVDAVGKGSKELTLGQIAQHARGLFPGTTITLNIPPALEITEYFAPQGQAVTSMADMAVVEVDPETCEMRLLGYASVHDCGRMLNRMIVEGQIRGGIVNGMGTALYEEIVYDAQGQLLTSTLMDYLVPSACEVPDIALSHVETLSPLNPLGVKGAGESGAIAAPAAIQSAVQDALRNWQVNDVTRIPVKPTRIRELFKRSSVR